jgi:N-acetyl-gamma-glutamyl-phosphate reductase
MNMTLNIAVLGASGYTGAELVRLLLSHPYAKLRLLTADRKAGQPYAEVFPQFVGMGLPDLVALDDVYARLADVDLVFCALPHGTTQEVIAKLFSLKPTLKVVDLSADFRLSSLEAYEEWYGHPHKAPELQAEAVYGLVEVYREKIAKARLVANPGCYTTASILALRPLMAAKVIDPEHIVIDAKSGVTGAGRALREGNLFTEVSEGFHAYGVGHHRHMAELDQEFSLAASREVVPTFTPHLVPMNRGILATCYVRGTWGREALDLHNVLSEAYAGEGFVHVLPFGTTPHTRHVRGSNRALIGVAADRQTGRAIVISAIDNLVKGASGQAVQNMNVMMGWPETLGLQNAPVFP